MEDIKNVSGINGINGILYGDNTHLTTLALLHDAELEDILVTALVLAMEHELKRTLSEDKDKEKDKDKDNIHSWCNDTLLENMLVFIEKYIDCFSTSMLYKMYTSSDTMLKNYKGDFIGVTGLEKNYYNRIDYFLSVLSQVLCKKDINGVYYSSKGGSRYAR